MFLLRIEKDLIECFRPRDQRRLELPDGVKYPLVVRDYFAWTDSSNLKVNVVFAEPEVRKPIGLTFDRPSSGHPTAAICDWCHSYGSSNQIGLLTIEATPRRTVGVNLCLDLGCRDKIETNTSLSPVAAQKRMREVVTKMSQFVRRTIL